MGRHPLAAVSVTYALLVASIVGVPLALGPGTASAANHTASGTTFAVGQGGECLTEVHPRGNGSLSGPEYYDYGEPPKYNESNDLFASHGTTEIQETFLSQVYTYDGSDGTSLVFLHDEWGDGAGGGAVTFNVTGLPTDAELTVEDDDYANRSDSFLDDGPEWQFNWMYGKNKTDGAVVLGLGEDDWVEVTVHPAFKEESVGHEEDWPLSTAGPDEWVVRDADDETTELNLEQPVSIREGTCGSLAPPEAVLSAPDNASPETDVTLNASNPADPMFLIRYEWDFEHNGTFEVDDTTDTPTVDHRYSSNGEVSAAVRVTDTYGNTDTATATIQVVNDTPPTAVADVPATAETGTSFAADGSGSSDETGIASYEWDFGDGGTATGQTATHTYDAPGNYTVTLTVTDDAGDSGTDTADVTVSDATPPNATLSAPQTSEVNTNATLDASGSTDNGEVARYEWDFGDGTTRTTNESSVEHDYTSTGTVTPTVTVVDEAGNEASASATISIQNASAPEAAFTVDPESPRADQEVTFDATNSTDESPIVRYEWDFDDGTTINTTEATTTHSYDEKGTYNVTLDVFDEAGEVGTARTSLSVKPAEQPSPGGGGGGGGGGAGGGGGGGGAGGDGHTTVTDEPEPNLVVTSLSTNRSSVLAGEVVAVTATIENRGEAAGSENFGPALERRPLTLRNVTLDPGESTNVTFAVPLDEPGTQRIGVGGVHTNVTVQARQPETAVESVRLEDSTIEAGETATVLVTVTNTGNAPGQHVVALDVFGEEVDRKTVTVGPGETRTVRFSQRFDAPGNYSVGVGDREATMRVAGQSGDSSRSGVLMSIPDASDRTTALGFVAGGGLVLAAVAILLGRRL